MPRWSVDELRAVLTRLQDRSRPSPLADRLSLDALRLRRAPAPAERDGPALPQGPVFQLENRNGVVAGSVTVEIESALRDSTYAALEDLAPFGVDPLRCAIYWSFNVKKERQGEGIGFLLAAAGAAWAADRGYAITGGAGLTRFTTSEAARATYRKLATLLPHAVVAGQPHWQTLVPTTFVVSEHPDGLQLPQEAALHRTDLLRLDALSTWLSTTAPRAVVSGLPAKVVALGGDERLLRPWQRIQQRVASGDGRVQAMKVEVDLLRARSKAHVGTATTYATPLPVLYGGPLRGVLVGALAAD